MSDTACKLLLTLIPNTSGRNLFVVDENYSQDDLTTLAARVKEPAKTLVISNRYDLSSQSRALGLAGSFNDFDFSRIPAGSLDNLFFCISKERAVAHHIINSASRVLCAGGRLHLAGTKQQGIKTLVKNACKLFADNTSCKKKGNFYLASISKQAVSETYLDDNHYSEIREIARINGKPVFSKPGLFGWQKIDQGSTLLVSRLAEFLADFPDKPALLDLGCGYGYLSIMASHYGAAPIVATDNNAAAVICCEKNFSAHHITGGAVEADDCALGNKSLFDAIVCHPPFHKGFDVSSKLGERFIQAACTHLKPAGKALFVANSFVPLENLARYYFSDVQKIADNKQFKLVFMQKGRQRR